MSDSKIASILIDWGNKIAGKLGELALGEARYLICFKCIVEEFENEKEKLIDRKKSVEEDVADARNRVENVRYEVEAWLKNAEKYIKEEPKELYHEKEDTKRKMTFLCRFYPKCLGRYYRGKELDAMKLEISELRKQNFDKVGRVARVPGVEFYAQQNFVELNSRISTYKQLLESLKDGSDYIVGLHGLAGTGKTTLAKRVGLELKQQKLFDEVVFTTVSNDPNITKIQDEIAGPLGLVLKDVIEIDRPKKLWSRLTSRDKILIILDDVWDKVDFNAIGIPSSDKNHRCRVLLTSRDAGVIYLVGCEKIITLKPLSDEDAQFLFESLAGISKKSPKDLKDKGKGIAKECKGLPMAIATIASTLKGRPLKDWRTTLTALKNVRDTNELIQIYKRLKISYDHLNNDEAKRLLLLCSLFPEDYKIPVEDLTRFGIGLGFGDFHLCEATRSRMDKARTALIDSCFLLEGEKGCVRMHDLVRDAARWIANNEKQLGILDMVSNAIGTQNTNAISYLYCYDIFINDQLDLTKLEILILTDINGSLQETFFERMRNLRVLALYSRYKMFKMELSLPQSIGSLEKLRTLCLRDFELGNITIVESLQSLEILELKNCSMDELPIGIAKFAKLRLLSLKHCEFEQSPYKVIGQLYSLQELYFKDITYKMSSGETRDLMKEVVGNLFDKDSISKTLQRYHLDIQDSYRWKFDRSLSRALAIQYFDPNASSAPIKDLLRRAERLDFLHIQGGYKAVIPDVIEAIGGDMDELTYFKLYSCSKIEYLIDATNVGSLSMAKTIFSKLVGLYLSNMDALTSLFIFSTAQCLVTLEELVIDECRELKYIIRDEQSREKDIVEDGRDPMFPKLKTLRISHCDQLEFIFLIFLAGDLPLLENVEISDCGELKYIFGQCQLDDQVSLQNEKEIILPSLEEVTLSNVPEFIYVFQKYCHPNPNSSFVLKSSPRNNFMAEQQDLPKRFSLPCGHMCCFGSAHGLKLRKSATNTASPIVSKVSQTSNYESVCPSNTVQCLLGQSLILRNTKKISLKYCGVVTSLFSLSIAAEMLLEELVIMDCDGLKHIIADVGDSHDHMSIFPKLKKLNVWDCSKMIHMVGGYDEEGHKNGIHIDLSALEYLTLANLPNMAGICPINYYATNPSLGFLWMYNCPSLGVKSVGDMMMFRPDATQQHGTATMDLEGTLKHLQTLDFLYLNNIGIKNIFDVEGLPINDGEQISLSLRVMMLRNLAKLKYIWGGLQNFVTFQNLNDLQIVGCDELKVIFSASILRRISVLKNLIISNCQKLEKIVEEDEENVCFPELRALIVFDCNSLKHVLSTSIPHQDQFPKLKGMILIRLPDLTNAMDQLERVEYWAVYGCNFNTPSSIAELMRIKQECLGPEDPMELGYPDLKKDLQRVFDEIIESHNEDSSKETNNVPSGMGTEKEAASECEQPSSQEQKDAETEESEETEEIEETQESEETEGYKSEDIVEESLSKKADVNVTSTSLEPQPSPSPQSIEETENHIHQKGPKSDQQIAEESLSKIADVKVTSSTSFEPQSSPTPQSIVKTKEQNLEESSKAKEVDHMSIVKTKEPSHEKFSKSKEVDHMEIEESKELILGGDHMVTSSAPSEAERAQSSSSITPIHKASSQDDGVAHVPMPPISVIAEDEHPTVKDNLVAKVFADLEVYLKMPLKDIASSKMNRIKLETSLNFLSCFFIENGALSHELKSLIDSLQEELPGLLCSFSEASAVLKKFAELEEREKSIKEKLTKQTQAEFAFASKISQIHKLKDEAQQKETRLEFEKLKKEKSQMEEKKRKAQQELLKTEYEWSFLCCQFKDNRRAGKVPTSTQLGSRNSMISHLREACLQDKIEVIQGETSTIEDTKDIPIYLQDFEEDNQLCMPEVSPVATENSVIEDNLVSKVLSDLEASLKMPLKDIASSKDNAIRLYTALNFLSNLPFEDGAVSDELKAILNSLHQDFPRILSSFNEAFAVIKKFAELEEREKSFEKENIKDYDADLSRLRKEFASVKKDKEQMVEDQRKAQQKLLETNYKWWDLCSRFKMNSVALGNVF